MIRSSTPVAQVDAIATYTIQATTSQGRYHRRMKSELSSAAFERRANTPTSGVCCCSGTLERAIIGTRRDAAEVRWQRWLGGEGSRDIARESAYDGGH